MRTQIKIACSHCGRVEWHKVLFILSDEHVRYVKKIVTVCVFCNYEAEYDENKNKVK